MTTEIGIGNKRFVVPDEVATYIHNLENSARKKQPSKDEWAIQKTACKNRIYGPVFGNKECDHPNNPTGKCTCKDCPIKVQPTSAELDELRQTITNLSMQKSDLESYYQDQIESLKADKTKQQSVIETIEKRRKFLNRQMKLEPNINVQGIFMQKVKELEWVLRILEEAK